MQVFYLLSAVIAVVGNEPISVTIKPYLCCNLLNKRRHRRHNLTRGILKTLYVHFWNDKHMDRGLGVDIVKCKKLIVFMDFVARNFTFDDLTKYTHNYPLKVLL